MSDNPFFDSNVLLYLASDDGAKANRAEALLADGGTISVQVLNEMSNVAIRKHGMTWSQVSALLEPGIDAQQLAESLGHFFVALEVVALAAQAALLAGADILYSEDMHDGLLVEDRLRIRNPFRVRSVQER